MLRKIIKIDKDKCNGCGLCVDACHEGAIGLIDGKATLLREDYCDGLGDCLPSCPTNAITFEHREALEYDKEAVEKNMAKKGGGCPGSNPKMIKRKEHKEKELKDFDDNYESQLSNWPVQIKLAPVNAAYFNNANLLIAADCAAFSYSNFHNKFMKNKVTLIGCPKLDEIDYSEKLAAIISNNDIKSVTVVRMEVPCCSGIVNAVKTALIKSGKMIPWQVVVLSTDGQIIEE